MIKYIKHNLALRLDSVGFVASTLCAIHCALMPFVILFLTVYGFQFIANPAVEFAFVSLSIIIGIYTFRHGYFNHHRRVYPFIIFLVGLAILIVGHFTFHSHSAHDGETEILLLIISPIGAFLVGAGHFLNRRLSKTTVNKSCSC